MSPAANGEEHDLIWVETTEEFYFRIPPRNTQLLLHPVSTDSITTEVEETQLDFVIPLRSEAQKRIALETALAHRYHRAILQLLNYGINLNLPSLSTTPLPHPCNGPYRTMLST
jgi:hypothetical protein